MAQMPSEFREGWPEENAIFRTARKRYRCEGSGARQSDACVKVIEPGTHYVEYIGETPAYERGSAHCLPCALAFRFIVPADEGTPAR